MSSLPKKTLWIRPCYMAVKPCAMLQKWHKVCCVLIYDLSEWQLRVHNKLNISVCCLSVNGVWGPWSQWSICSRTCNIGQRRRVRRCDSPAPSNGGLHCNYSGDSAVDVVNCKMDDCPDSLPSWSNWGPWSTCSVTCSNGTSTRSRTCQHSAAVTDCSGSSTETTYCRIRHCPGLSHSIEYLVHPMWLEA